MTPYIQGALRRGMVRATRSPCSPPPSRNHDYREDRSLKIPGILRWFSLDIVIKNVNSAYMYLLFDCDSFLYRGRGGRPKGIIPGEEVVGRIPRARILEVLGRTLNSAFFHRCTRDAGYTLFSCVRARTHTCPLALHPSGNSCGAFISRRFCFIIEPLRAPRDVNVDAASFAPMCATLFFTARRGVLRQPCSPRIYFTINYSGERILCSPRLGTHFDAGALRRVKWPFAYGSAG